MSGNASNNNMHNHKTAKGWIKLNTNCTAKGSPGLAACVGIFEGVEEIILAVSLHIWDTKVLDCLNHGCHSYRCVF